METDTTNGILRDLRRSALLRDGGGPTDGQLLDSFIDHRDDDAFAALVRRHGPMVWGVCRRLLGRPDAEDAFQATFLVLVRKAATVVPRERLGNWLYGVAHQTALQARRTTTRRARRECRVADVPEPAVTEPDRPCDLRPLLDQELSRLPDNYRAVIVLCDLEGRTRAEAARQLGVPDGSVSGWLARGRAMLAKRLTRRGVALSAGALAVALGRTAGGAPPSVVSLTIKAASVYAAGPAAITGVISTNASALTEGVLNAMRMSRLKFKVAMLLVAACVGGAVAFLHPAAGQPPPAEKRVGAAKVPAGERRQSETNQDRLQGRWAVVSVEKDGRVLTPEELKEEDIDDVCFKGGRIEPTRADPENSLWHGEFKLDERREPKQITLSDKEPDGQVMTFRGIYALDGDTLKWCMNHDGTDVCRPEEFRTKKGSPLRVFTFKRVKTEK